MCGMRGKVIFLASDGLERGTISAGSANGYSSAPPDKLNYPGSADVSSVFCAEHLELDCCTRPYELYSKKIGRGDNRLSIGDM